jgi:type IV secretory pathway VirD2 relaxase
LNKEIEADVLAEAERRIAARSTVNPNGSAETQQRAAFITRNIGRR